MPPPTRSTRASSRLHLAETEDIAGLLEELRAFYAGRGVNLVHVAGKWAFRTAEDLAYLLERFAVQERRLSKAALKHWRSSPTTSR